MTCAPGHVAPEYAALGVFLMFDAIKWRDVLTSPPSQRPGQVAVAIVGLILVVGTLLDLLDLIPVIYVKHPITSSEGPTRRAVFGWESIPTDGRWWRHPAVGATHVSPAWHKQFANTLGFA